MQHRTTIATLRFDGLLDQVLLWWPNEIRGQVQDYQDEMQSSSVAAIYEEKIESVSLNSNSMLLIQLDWIVFAIVDELSRRAMTIKPRDVRRSLVKERFHQLILREGIPQLRGEKDWDGSFDKAELEAYVAANNLAGSCVDQAQA
jgi:hypothetical protein